MRDSIDNTNTYQTVKRTRKSIPKIVKNMVWDENIGEEKGIGECYCCSQKINSKNFEAGHIVSVKNGGPTTLNNLKPICSCCNKSMGIENMENFKKTYMTDRKPYNESKNLKSKAPELKQPVSTQYNTFDLLSNCNQNVFMT